MSLDFNKKKFEYTPILGWSATRYSMFTTCKRMYYYHYYNKFDRVYSRNRILKLKDLTSIPLVTGQIVHTMLKSLLYRFLKEESKINRFKFLFYARKKTKEICQNSNFSEIYYNQCRKINVDKIYDKVKISLTNFLESDRYKWLTNQALKNKDKWIIEPPGYGETRIKDLKAYAKVDFLFPVKKKLVIIDWKTGQPRFEKHKKQLMGYTAWACFHFNLLPDNIEAINAYLFPEYTEVSCPTNEFSLEDFFYQVKKETKEMYNYCQDIENNIPLPKPSFQQTNNKKICTYCNFKELCH